MARDEGRRARGYAFYHMQDTENAVEGYGIYLNYGSCEEGSDAAVAIGDEIASELEAKGFKANWDGTIEKRIGLSLDWKRRRSFS